MNYKHMTSWAKCHITPLISASLITVIIGGAFLTNYIDNVHTNKKIDQIKVANAATIDTITPDQILMPNHKTKITTALKSQKHKIKQVEINNKIKFEKLTKKNEEQLAKQKAQQELEQKAKLEAEQNAKREAEQKAQADAEQQAKLEVEQQNQQVIQNKPTVTSAQSNRPSTPVTESPQNYVVNGYTTLTGAQSQGFIDSHPGSWVSISDVPTAGGIALLAHLYGAGSWMPGANIGNTVSLNGHTYKIYNKYVVNYLSEQEYAAIQTCGPGELTLITCVDASGSTDIVLRLKMI